MRPYTFEVSRPVPSTAATKESCTDGLLSVVDAIAAAIAPDNPASARRAVLDAFAMMVGAVQLSRAVDDPVRAQEVLDNVTRKVLAMLEVPAT